MSSKWLLVAVLALGACGEVDTAGPESSTGRQVIDLRVGGEAHDIDVHSNAVDETDVVERTGRRLSLNLWIDAVARHNNLRVSDLMTSDDGHVIVVRDRDDYPMQPEEAEERAAEMRDMVSEQSGHACPSYCTHCPEQGVYVCSTMCGPTPGIQ